MPVPKLTFTERLVRYREMKGLSQRALAQRIGISSAYLNDIEHGRRGPTVNLVNVIAEEFNFGPYLHHVWHLAAARAHGWEV